MPKKLMGPFETGVTIDLSKLAFARPVELFGHVTLVEG